MVQGDDNTRRPRTRVRRFVQVLAGAALVAFNLVIAVIGGLRGWWMTPVAEPGDHEGFYTWAAVEIETGNPGAAAFLMIEDGRVVHSYFSPGVDRDTLFPTASVSKWIAALGVMSLAERGLLDLDAPVSRYLSRWQFPESPFGEEGVTARRLLSHTAGLTDELGFGDYTADERLPSIEDELRQSRASNGTGAVVAIGQQPGGKFLYSGGGYLVLELLVEEVSGDLFATYIEDSVLEPLGMSRSTYRYLGDIDNVAPSFDTDGSVAPTYRYASAAATGFSSSAADLGRLVDGVLSADEMPLGAETIAAMREPHGFSFGAAIWGLGNILYAPTPGGDFVFGHEGVNDPAINSSVRVNPETAGGFVLLISGHPALATAIGSEWTFWQTGHPDILSVDRAVASALLPALLGSLLLLAAALWKRRRRR